MNEIEDALLFKSIVTDIMDKHKIKTILELDAALHNLKNAICPKFKIGDELHYKEYTGTVKAVKSENDKIQYRLKCDDGVTRTLNEYDLFATEKISTEEIKKVEMKTFKDRVKILMNFKPDKQKDTVCIRKFGIKETKQNLKDIKISEKIDEIFLELCKQVTDKELRRLISDFAALHRMLGAHHANPERYSKFLDDMCVPKETNMYDRCYCSSNCKNDSCGRKNSSNEPFCTTSDFSNFCKSYKK